MGFLVTHGDPTLIPRLAAEAGTAEGRQAGQEYNLRLARAQADIDKGVATTAISQMNAQERSAHDMATEDVANFNAADNSMYRSRMAKSRELEVASRAKAQEETASYHAAQLGLSRDRAKAASLSAQLRQQAAVIAQRQRGIANALADKTQLSSTLKSSMQMNNAQYDRLERQRAKMGPQDWRTGKASHPDSVPQEELWAHLNANPDIKAKYLDIVQHQKDLMNANTAYGTRLGRLSQAAASFADNGDRMTGDTYKAFVDAAGGDEYSARLAMRELGADPDDGEE